MIRFIRPTDGYTEGQVVSLEPEYEQIYTSRIFAEYVDAPVAKPKAKKVAVNTDNAAVEGSDE
jgi:hypothetical protein